MRVLLAPGFEGITPFVGVAGEFQEKKKEMLTLPYVSWGAYIAAKSGSQSLGQFHPAVGGWVDIVARCCASRCS